jgi:hypothetical protein
MKNAIGADGIFRKDLLVALYSRCGKSANRCRWSLKPSKSQIVEILLQNQERKFLTDRAHGVSWPAEKFASTHQGVTMPQNDRVGVRGSRTASLGSSRIEL